MSPIYQTSSTKVQPVQPQVLNSVPTMAKESKQPMGPEQHAPGGDRPGSPTTVVGKPALPPKPPPPLVKTSTPPPPPRQSAYHLPQYHQPDTSSDDGGGRAYYTADCRPAQQQQQQKDLTPPPRIPNGNGPVRSNFGDSSESDNSSSSASMRSVFGNATTK